MVDTICHSRKGGCCPPLQCDRRMCAMKLFGCNVATFRPLLRFISAFVLLTCAQTSVAASVEDIALLRGVDRQKILVEGAKKEGKLSFYTTLIVEQVVRPMKEAFEREYPFIQMEYFRGNSDRIAQKLFAEYQAKRYAVDVIDGSSTTTMVRRAGMLQRFFSPQFAEYPAELKDAEGFWGVSNIYFHTLGY